MPSTLTSNQRQLIAELVRDDLLALVENEVKWKIFKVFEAAPPDERWVCGAQLDALTGVMREFKSIAKEVAVSGRIERTG